MKLLMVRKWIQRCRVSSRARVACMRRCQCFCSYLYEHWSPNNTLKTMMMMMRRRILLKMMMMTTERYGGVGCGCDVGQWWWLWWWLWWWWWWWWWCSWQVVGYILLGYSALLRGLEGIKSTPRPYCSVYDYYLLSLISWDRDEDDIHTKVTGPKILGQALTWYLRGIKNWGYSKFWVQINWRRNDMCCWRGKKWHRWLLLEEGEWYILLLLEVGVICRRKVNWQLHQIPTIGRGDNTANHIQCLHNNGHYGDDDDDAYNGCLKYL